MQTSTQEKIFQIFRAGEHVSMSGQRCSFALEDLRRIAGAYDPRLYRAPLVLGHPKIEDITHGFVQEVFVKDDGLYVRAQVDDALVAMVRSGEVKDRSASFFKADQTGNPRPSAFYLRHVGFLGAQRPAVKGMPALRFSESNPLLADIENHYFCCAEAAEIRDSNPLIRDAESRSMGEKFKW